MRRSRSLSNLSTGAFKVMYLDDGSKLCQQIRRTQSLSDVSTRALKDFWHIGIADQLQKYIDGMERKADILDHLARRALFEIEQETLVTEVCDETSVAELNLEGNIGATDTPIAISSPVVALPIPSEPMDLSGHAKPSPASPKSGKLAALEASGYVGFKLVSSPVVGSFSRGRMVKGKKHPPVYKEGDLIKEGQIIGYVDQFGTHLPVKSDVDGELLKVLFNDGEAVGYGDPLVAILPSLPGLN